MDERRAALREFFRQVSDGWDIPSPHSLLSRIKPEDASVKLPNSPYSLLTNLAHAHFWQDLWLKRLHGERATSITKDWRVPEPEDFYAIRQAFLDGYAEVIRILESDPFQHKMKSDEMAIQTLTQVAIHDAYHLGQIKLLKRMQRLAKKCSGED